MENKREIVADEREEVAGKIELAISIDDAEYDGNKLRYEILDLLESKGLKGAEIWGQKTYSCSRKDTKIEGSIQEKQENQEEKILCKTCGNDTFRVYAGVSIDDARMYCIKCGKDPEER